MDYISIIHSLRRVTVFMLVLMVFTLLQSCKKCQDDDGTPAEPCPCIGDACIDEMMAYTYFLPGTWWVYEEQNSGARDSVYVYEAFEGETDEGQRYFTVRMHSTYDEYNYYHEFWETLAHSNVLSNCRTHRIYRSKTRPGDFVGSANAFLFPLILNDYIFPGLTGDLSTDSIWSGYTLEGLNYRNVVLFNIDDCFSEDYESASFYLAEQVGVIQKLRPEISQIWHLGQYHIVQ